MKRLISNIACLLTIAALSCACGDDRSEEYYELTKENQWTFNTMKERYLWRASIGDVKQQTFFYDASKFFKNLLSKEDKTSFFTDTVATTSYGMKFALMRDPLGIAPAKTYALVLYVEPSSVAAAAGIERGTWISGVGGNNLSSTNTAILTDGESIGLNISRIVFDEENEKYIWENADPVVIGASAPTEAAAVPLVTTTSTAGNKIGYILCNNFDSENFLSDTQNALSQLAAEGATDIVLDLRYADGTSLSNAAAAASLFVTADKKGTLFCTLYKDLELNAKEEILFPEASTNASDKPLYIVTSSATSGVANIFTRAIRLARGTADMKIVGEPTSGNNQYTEPIQSPYGFTINPVTALIYDANGEATISISPDFEVNELAQPQAIYPLGNKQEYILYNISYIMANGTLPEPAVE